MVGDFGSPAPEEFRTYVPEETYEVGEFIYHQTWRDVGRVIGEIADMLGADDERVGRLAQLPA